MKRARLIAVGVGLALVLSLAGACAGEVGPAPEAPMEAVQWDCMIYMAGITTFHDIEQQKAFDRIKARTGGLLDIRTVPQGALPLKAEEWLRAVSEGKLGMTQAGGGYHSGDWPFLGLVDVPFVYSTKLEKRKVYEAVLPIYQRELGKDDIYVLSYRPSFTMAASFSQPVDIMDLKGLKVRAYNRPNAKQLEAMGGVPVTIAWNEVYSAIEKGVANGMLTGLDSMYSAKMYEVAPYYYNTGPLHGIWFLAVKKSVWDSFPKSVQNIVYEELSAWQGQGLIYTMQEMEHIGVLVEEVTGNPMQTVPQAYYDLMTEEVTKPFLKEEMEKTGEPLASEVVGAIEAALGRSLR